MRRRAGEAATRAGRELLGAAALGAAEPRAALAERGGAAAEDRPGGRGRCWPRAPRRHRPRARHQLGPWGGEGGEERRAPSRRTAFKFVV